MAIAVQQIHPVAHLPLVLGVLRRLEVATVIDHLIPVIRKNYGNDVLPEANYAVLGRRYSVRKYLRVDKL